MVIDENNDKREARTARAAPPALVFGLRRGRTERKDRVHSYEVRCVCSLRFGRESGLRANRGCFYFETTARRSHAVVAVRIFAFCIHEVL